MKRLAKFWAWLKRVPILGWLIAVIVVLGVGFVHVLRQRDTARARTRMETERRKIQEDETAQLAAIETATTAEKEAIEKKSEVRKEKLKKRVAAIDVAAEEDSEKFAEALEAALRRRRQRKGGGS